MRSGVTDTINTFPSRVEMVLEGPRVSSITPYRMRCCCCGVFSEPGRGRSISKGPSWFLKKKNFFPPLCLVFFFLSFYQYIAAQSTHKPRIKAGIMIVARFLSAPGFN